MINYLNTYLILDLSNIIDKYYTIPFINIYQRQDWTEKVLDLTWIGNYTSGYSWSRGCFINILNNEHTVSIELDVSDNPIFKETQYYFAKSDIDDDIRNLKTSCTAQDFMNSHMCYFYHFINYNDFIQFKNEDHYLYWSEVNDKFVVYSDIEKYFDKYKKAIFLIYQGGNGIILFTNKITEIINELEFVVQFGRANNVNFDWV